MGTHTENPKTGGRPEITHWRKGESETKGDYQGRGEVKYQIKESKFS